MRYQNLADSENKHRKPLEVVTVIRAPPKSSDSRHLVGEFPGSSLEARLPKQPKPSCTDTHAAQRHHVMYVHACRHACARRLIYTRIYQQGAVHTYARAPATILPCSLAQAPVGAARRTDRVAKAGRCTFIAELGMKDPPKAVGAGDPSSQPGLCVRKKRSLPSPCSLSLRSLLSLSLSIPLSPSRSPSLSTCTLTYSPLYFLSHICFLSAAPLTPRSPCITQVQMHKHMDKYAGDRHANRHTGTELRRLRQTHAHVQMHTDAYIHRGIISMHTMQACTPPRDARENIETKNAE